MTDDTLPSQPDGGLMTLHLTSANCSGPDAFEQFREVYGRALMQITIDPTPGHPFEMDFFVRGFAGFGLASGRLSATRNTHTVDMINNDDVVLVFTPQGHGTLKQTGREVTIQNGEATLIANGMPGVFYGHETSQLHNFRLDRNLLSSLVPDIDAALVRVIPHHHPALALMARYAEVMRDESSLATPELRRSVALHMHDLAALALGVATREGAEVAQRRGVRAARMRAIKDDIARQISLPSLSISDIATRQGISAAYIRKLFSINGTSFSDFVLAERLSRAYRMLQDPRFASRPISAIAYDVGFSDLSYFNRTFRRRYNATPSDIRAAH